MLTVEQWKAIPGFSEYQASHLGNVRSFKRDKFSGKLLKPARPKRGYRNLTLCKDGQEYHFRVAQLVLLTFLGPCPPGLEVCHNDGNRTNDHLDNLRYDTHKANIGDAIRQGKKLGPPCLFTDKEAKQIRIQYASGLFLQKELAYYYDTSLDTINRMVAGRSYKNAGGPITKKRVLLSDKAVKKIRQARTNGASLNTIAERYNISQSYVSYIVNYKRRT